MNWADFYLICFLFGFLLSVVSLLFGGLHLHVFSDLHLHFDVGHMDAPGLDSPDASADVPIFNLGTIAAFLAWFGGTGYLLVRFSNLWVFFALGVAFASGLAGAAVIFFFLARVLMREEREREAESEGEDMIGVLGHLSLPIRENGTGELVYAQGGTRHCTAARSEDGAAIPKGSEVVVTRYDKGVAYVRRWDDLAGGAGEATDN